MTKKGTCPSCYFEIEVNDDVILGEILECPDCSSELEIIEIKNDEVVFQIAEEVEDDWGE
ncbi:MAG: hypothetical protein ACTSQO_01910 [Candidatus Helarchaeota archaeon]